MRRILTRGVCSGSTYKEGGGSVPGGSKSKIAFDDFKTESGWASGWKDFLFTRETALDDFSTGDISGGSGWVGSWVDSV